MNTSLSWIKQYVPDLDCTAKEYADAMTLSGTKVECFEEMDRDLDKIVVGLVKTCNDHPDSDHLHVCTVDVGTGEDLQIVCGAPNVAAGQKVPVVLVGGKVAGGHDGKMTEGGIEIKAGKLRGIESFGMICSIEELGSTPEFFPEAPEYGIYVFPDDTPIGADAVELLGLHDAVIEYEITSNRVDCYSVIGIAREAAATFNKPFVYPDVKETGNDEDVHDYIDVKVQDPDLCSRYCARAVKNVKIGPSPKWMQRRLMSNGIRPINNIVDITNYVMEEYGQPTHSFDYDTIANHQIIVRRAEDGDVFTTLDGQDRKLDHDVLMICDGEKEIGIAGIMGGENSMITDDVKTVLFEAACFNGTNIRLSAKRIGLQTDASAKFDKGLDPNTAIEAVNRACQLMEEFGAGEVIGGVVDVHGELPVAKRIPFNAEKINGLLGTDLPAEEMLGYFKAVDLEYDAETNEVVVPTWRQDVLRPCDLAEEVARFWGYDKIPTTLPHGEATEGRLQEDMRINDIARRVIEDCGFSQAYSYSFESPKVFNKLMLDADDKLRQAIEISNPLGEDFSIMRTISLNGMLTSLAFNSSRRNENVHLYETGNVYIPKSLPLTELPDERMTLTLGFYGQDDFFDMKGVLEVLFERLGITSPISYEASNLKNYLHPGRQAEIIINKQVVGYLGEVHPQVRKNYGIRERAYVAVLDMPVIYPMASFDRKFQGIARFPAVTRDISLVVPKNVTNGQIMNMIRQRGGKLMESCRLFDVYEGPGVEEGTKSLAYKLMFRHAEKTLEENEITAVMKKIMNGLESLNITLRS
ncbi:MAG: phenylalanine--tRNA ligase subunit beta [Lachnospiraceae bacterium]|nr:phenylalanine--tRNA ligase subunit beta [Candidatus Equihabitans merdae]